MTKGSDLAGAGSAEIRTIDIATANLSAILAEVAGIPDPVPPAPPCPGPGFDPSKVDWERPPLSGAITKNGTELENIPVDRVQVQAEDVWLDNVGPVGRSLPASGGAPVVDASSTRAKRFYMTDSLVTVAKPDARWIEGVRLGPDSVLERVVVTGTVDGFGWHNKAGGPVGPTMIDCEAYDLAWFPVDPLNSGHRDGTHCDAIQVHSPIVGGRIIGGTYDAGPKGTAGLMVNVKSVAGLTVSRAVFRGGRCGINFGPTPSVAAVLAYNVFDTPVPVYAVSATIPSIYLPGSTKADGTPVTVTKS